MFTELEKKVITNLASGSNWNGNDALDFTKEELKPQLCESSYCTYIETANIAETLGIKTNSVKGVLGSLFKKGCLTDMSKEMDDGMVMISPRNFHNIRKNLGLE